MNQQTMEEKLAFLALLMLIYRETLEEHSQFPSQATFQELLEWRLGEIIGTSI